MLIAVFLPDHNPILTYHPERVCFIRSSAAAMQSIILMMYYWRDFIPRTTFAVTIVFLFRTANPGYLSS